VRCLFSLSHCICGFHLGFTLEALIDRLLPLGPFSTSIVLSSPVVKRVVDRESLDTEAP